MCGHWQIENGLHYRHDVTLDEGGSLARIGQPPHVLAALNTFICGLIAQAGVTNLAAMQRPIATAVDRWPSPTDFALALVAHQDQL